MRYLSEYEVLRIIKRCQKEKIDKLNSGKGSDYDRFSIYTLNDFKKQVKFFLDTKYGK